MNILTFTTLYPNAAMPLNAVFVRRRMEACASLHRHDLTVVAPVPFFPRLPIATLKVWDRFAAVPPLESPWGYEIYHPRYLVTPKLGMRYYGRWMTQATIALVSELHARKRFDVIDAHYVYPDGEAAVAIGRALGLPVVLSGRGTDLSLYPTLPAIRPRIVRSLRQCRHLVCVSDELRKVALGLGEPQGKVSVIGNGIDPAVFAPRDRLIARAHLQLPADATLLLSVGTLRELKGFHILIESLALLKQEGGLPSSSTKLLIVGDGPQRPELQVLVKRLELQDEVVLAGAIDPDALPAWYAAADFFLLASSREGWPNVLCEAQAMGLPVIATRAWGIPEIVREPGLGLLVADRSAQAFAQGIRRALDCSWDRPAIASKGAQRTWPVVAGEVDAVLRRAAASFEPASVAAC
jgi:glycosyltransferase involved in cell wall biosynthesis